MRDRTTFFVTRQSYVYDDNRDAVEIALGLDNASPDALVQIFPGEMEGYELPTEAAAAAVRIAEAWGAETGEDIPITIAAAGAMGLYPTTEDGLTPDEARRWAEKREREMPRCDNCGEPGAEAWRGIDGEEYLACSEWCGREHAEMLEEERWMSEEAR